MPAPVSPALFDQFARGWRGYALIALIALTSSLFGADRVPTMDADEARFVQATRQMLESGDYVRIRLQDEARNRKPIGVHWLQAAAVQVALPITQRLNEIWPYRLPSALGAVLAALATFWGGAALVGRRAAFLGAGLFAAGMLVGFEGMTAKTDALVLGFTALAMAALAQLRTGPAPKCAALVFWAALACGVLVKGPIAPLVAMLTLGALVLWERRAAWIAPLLWWPGPLLCTLIVAPWAIAVSAQTDGQFFVDMMLGDLLPKLVSADEDHFALPGYHLLLLPVLIFPATYALPAAARLIWGTIRAPRTEEAQAPFRFLVAWALPLIVFFELMPTKLAHYTLPAYPAIALLCGGGLTLMRGRRWRTAHPIGIIMFAVSGAVLVALMAAGATFMPGDFSADLRRAISTALIGMAAVASAFAALLMLRRPAARAAVLVICALALSFSLRERILPEARALFVSDEVVAALTRARLAPREDRPLWVVGYDEASIVFLTRTSINLTPPRDAGAHAMIGDAFVVEGRMLQQTSAELALRNLVFAPAEPPVRGFALGRGERVALYIGRIEASEAAAGAQQRNP
jgi:4-amino-4-deoxy-L-arabinose transferase-like glycosyltransferase